MKLKKRPALIRPVVFLLADTRLLASIARSDPCQRPHDNTLLMVLRKVFKTVTNPATTSTLQELRRLSRPITRDGELR
jgi:hypothetical protein